MSESTEIKYVYLTKDQFNKDSVLLGIEFAKYLKELFLSGQLAWDATIFIVALWRGGAEVGITVQRIAIRLLTPLLYQYRDFPETMSEQEKLDAITKQFDHIAVRTSSYSSPTTRSKTVKIHGSKYVVKTVKDGDYIAIIDDVFDAGTTIEAVLDYFKNGIIIYNSILGRVLGFLGSLFLWKTHKMLSRFLKIFSSQLSPKKVGFGIFTVYSKPENNKSKFGIKPNVFISSFQKNDWLIFPSEFDERDENGNLSMTSEVLTKIYSQEVSNIIIQADLEFNDT